MVSNSGGGKPRVSGGVPKGDGCDIVEPTQLKTPNPVIVAQIVVGTVLRVVPAEVKNKKVLRAETSDRKVVGGLLPKHIKKILQCIEQGHWYDAIVDSINGGDVWVTIRPTP